MGVENRRQRRIGVALEVRIRGKDRAGLPFEETSSSENVSRGGFSLQSSHDLELGTELEIEIERRIPGRGEVSPFLTQGVVLRAAPTGDGLYAVGVRFTGPQFPTYASESTTIQES